MNSPAFVKINPDSANRLTEIDGLRAISAVLVLLAHGFRKYYPHGGFGVDIFFVISGLVITRYLIRSKPTFKDFYTSRVLRLIPPAFSVLAFSIAMHFLGFGNANFSAFVAAALSYMNWYRAFEISPTDGGFVAHFWSLSVEEQFYFFWPVILPVLLKKKLPIQTLLVLAIVMVFAWRLYGQLSGFSENRIYNGFDMRADGLLLGCLLAFLPPRDLGLWGAFSLAALVALGAWNYDKDGLFPYVSYPLITLLSGITVYASASGRSVLHGFLNHRIMQWLGSRSYAIYLWHFPLLMIAFDLGRDYQARGIVMVVPAYLLTLLAAELSFRLIEKPLRQRRHRRTANGHGAMTASLAQPG